jgi:hypothetical protein
MKDMNTELQEMKDLLVEKDTIIQELQNQEVKLNQANSYLNDEENIHSLIRMEYLSRKVSREAEDPKFTSTYIKKI